MILPFRNQWPVVAPSVYIAPSADVMGDVVIGEESSVWFQCVIRGDVHRIRIGSRTNIQDHSMLHVTRKTAPLTVGDEVTVGHRVLLHGCTIGSRVLVGMGAVVMDQVEVADDCVIGAGALLTQGKHFPSKSLIVGSPAKVVRPLKPEEIAFLKKSADNYVKDAKEYIDYFKENPIN